MIRMLDGAADLVAEHLRAMQAPFYSDSYCFVAINDGDELMNYDGICFLSGANARFPRELAYADLCEVEFYLETGIRGLYGTEQAVTSSAEGGLWMRIDPTPDDDVESGGYLLCLGEMIASFNCSFFDGYEWVEDWYYNYEAPEAIEFSMTVVDPDELVGPMSVTRLVSIPMAETINNASGAEDTAFTDTTETEQPGTGEEAPEEGGPEEQDN
jgi:hypothetical protein